MWELEHDKPYFLFGIAIWRYFALPGFLILIATAPMFMAVSVSLTRIVDYHHFYDDVIAGALLGVFWSITGFLMYRDEFRESSKKHDLLFENFTNEIKNYFLKVIRKNKHPNNNYNQLPKSKSLQTGSNQNSKESHTFTTSNNENSTNSQNANNNNNTTTVNLADSTENKTNDATATTSNSSELKKSKTRSIFFWCKALCFSCDEDCQRVWKICLCRHSDTDHYRMRSQRQNSLASLDENSDFHEVFTRFLNEKETNASNTVHATKNLARKQQELYRLQAQLAASKQNKSVALMAGIYQQEEVKAKNQLLRGSINNGKSGMKKTELIITNTEEIGGRGFRYDKEQPKNKKDKKGKQSMIRSKTEKNIFSMQKKKDGKTCKENENETGNEMDVSSVGGIRGPERAVSGPSRTFEPNKTFRD